MPSIDPPVEKSARILHYLPSDVHGGVEEHALSILVSLREFGFEGIMAAPQTLLRAMKSELDRAGVGTLAVEPFSPLDPRAMVGFARTIRDARASLIHCHMFGATLRAAPLARLMGMKAVVVETCHGPEAWRFGKPLKGRFWVDRLLTAGLVDRYIAVSRAAAAHLRERKGISTDKITVIHNGRDLTRYRTASEADRSRARAKLGLGDAPTILVLGRLDTQKGHVFLLEALGMLAPHRPEMITLLAGDGPLREQLVAQARDAGLADRVRFLGFRSDAPTLLAACDMVVLPSLYEGLPLVAIEALAAGKPIVATAVGGTPEVVNDGQSGLLVPPANPGALACAIGKVLDSPSLASRFALNGRERVERDFALRAQIEKTVAVYRELTSESVRRTSPSHETDGHLNKWSTALEKAQVSESSE